MTFTNSDNGFAVAKPVAQRECARRFSGDDGLAETSGAARTIMVQTPMGAAMMVHLRARPVTVPPAVMRAAGGVVALHAPVNGTCRPVQQGGLIMLDQRVAAAASTR